jgi:hypothetical protein
MVPLSTSSSPPPLLLVKLIFSLSHHESPRPSLSTT